MKNVLLLLLVILSFNAISHEFESDMDNSSEESYLYDELGRLNTESEDFFKILNDYKILIGRKNKRIFRKSFGRQLKKTLKKSNKKWPGPTLLCLYTGVSIGLQGQELRCTDGYKTSYSLTMTGVSGGVSLAAGVVIIKTKNYDIEGSYSYRTDAGYLGLGYMSGKHIKTSDDKAEPEFIVKGLGLGLGWDIGLSRVRVTKEN